MKEKVLSQTRRTATRDHIKAVAQRLFAEGGLRNVTTRQIASAAGHRNVAVINYYFKSKSALIDELINDVARTLEADRNAKLDALEATGGPHGLREVLEIMATPIQTVEEIDDSGADTTTRFVAMLLINHREEVLRVTGQAIDSGTRRCLAHLRRLSPRRSAAEITTRITLVTIFLVAVLVSEEIARAQPKLRPTNLVRHMPRAKVLDAAEAILLAD